MASVAIIGGGVVGLSTAVALQRTIPSVSVTLITEKLSPDTTGDGSAGFWEPYLLDDTPTNKILQWSRRSYEHFRDLWKSPAARTAGVSLIPAINVTTDENEALPFWSQVVIGYTPMGKKEISYFSTTSGKEYKSGFYFISFCCEPTKYLPMLLEEFKKQGGILQQRHVSSFLEFTDSAYDVVVNCTGLQARFLVPDLKVYPVRGQVIRVKSPWTFHSFMDDSETGFYVIPNHETVILGGTRQRDDWRLDVSPSDSKTFYSQCISVLPNLKAAPIVKEWVGLRPARNEVRLERETRKLPSGKELEIVHNYGHGGAGVTLSWGCAEEAVCMIRKILEERTTKAKL